MTDAPCSGFADLALDSARAFRPLLDAMARPGRLVAFAPDIAAPLQNTAAALCLTLCDGDTPLWIAPSLCDDEVLDYLRFHAGAPIARDPASAAFLLCDASTLSDALAGASIGTAEYPDRSATLIVLVDSCDGGFSVSLSGPGIAAAQTFAPRGLDREMWRRLQRNHALFPLGIDCIFAAANVIAALPRSAAIRFAEPS